MKLELRGANGLTVATVEAKRFSHYIGNIRYWFAYHQAHDRTNQLVITEPTTGMRVALIDFNTRLACVGDDKLAAKMTLDKLVQRVGADRVKEVLDRAMHAAN